MLLHLSYVDTLKNLYAYVVSSGGTNVTRHAQESFKVLSAWYECFAIQGAQRVSRTQLFALEIWTVRVRCLWCRLRSTSYRCFSCAVHSATSTTLVRIRNEVRHGVASQTPFADNLSLAITHLGLSWETLLDPVVKRSQQVSFRLQRSWSPQISSGAVCVPWSSVCVSGSWSCACLLSVPGQDVSLVLQPNLVVTLGDVVRLTDIRGENDVSCAGGE